MLKNNRFITNGIIITIITGGKHVEHEIQGLLRPRPDGRKPQVFGLQSLPPSQSNELRQHGLLQPAHQLVSILQGTSARSKLYILGLVSRRYETHQRGSKAPMDK